MDGERKLISAEEIDLDILPLEQNLFTPTPSSSAADSGVSWSPDKLFLQYFHLFGLAAILIMVILVMVLLAVLYASDISRRIFPRSHHSSADSPQQTTATASSASLIR